MIPVQKLLRLVQLPTEAGSVPVNKLSSMETAKTELLVSRCCEHEHKNDAIPNSHDDLQSVRSFQTPIVSGSVPFMALLATMNTSKDVQLLVEAGIGPVIELFQVIKLEREKINPKRQL